MQITKVQHWRSGYKVNNQFFIPADEYNLDYQDVLTYINNGGIVEPEFTDEQLLNNAKSSKLKELSVYHDSPEVRILTINGIIALPLNSASRSLVNEQIINLNNEIELGDKTPTTAIFNYYTGTTTIPINLENLKKVSVKMLSITNSNFTTYQKCLEEINNLQSISEVNAYDFKADYIKNSTLII